MYVTALLMLLVLFSMIWSGRKEYAGLKTFDRNTTLPFRGLLALLIVSHHLGQATKDLALSGFTVGIGYQIVGIFFMLSGYGLCASYRAKREKYISGFLKKRMGKLLPVFILLTAFMVIVNLLIGHKSLSEQAYMLFVKGATPLPHSWFIYSIIYVYLAFYFCIRSNKSPRHVGLTFLSAILLYIVVFSRILRFPPWWWMTILSVNLGYFIALYEDKISRLLVCRRYLLYPMVIAFLFGSFCIMCKVHVAGSAWLMLWIISQSLAVYVVMRSVGFAGWQWLCAVGVFSLELYLVHGIPLILGRHLDLHGYTLWLFTYALAIPAAWLLHRFTRTIAERAPRRASAQ